MTKKKSPSQSPTIFEPIRYHVRDLISDPCGDFVLYKDTVEALEERDRYKSALTDILERRGHPLVIAEFALGRNNGYDERACDPAPNYFSGPEGWPI